jgi:hypothetical protein
MPFDRRAPRILKSTLTQHLIDRVLQNAKLARAIETKDARAEVILES